MKKQIIISYDEYKEMEESIFELKKILANVYFNEEISEILRNEIKEANRIHGWWI